MYDATALNWVRTGRRDGQPVVLIHSLGLDLTYWDNQIEALGRDFDLVAYDIAGHGRSPGVPADWTIDVAAAQAASLIEHLEVGPAHVVGVSFGGMIAQTLAFDALDRLGGIVCPTLVLVSENDKSTPPASAAMIAERIAGAQLVILQGGAHLTHLDTPGALNLELVRFLSNH